jgi:hypothetical protein
MLEGGLSPEATPIACPVSAARVEARIITRLDRTGRPVFQNLIPKIFYAQLQDGLDFFVRGLGFAVDYQDAGMAVVSRDGAKAYLVENAACAALDRPELGIDTDDIDAVHAEMSARVPHLLHPNARTVTRKPWGAREFAMLDPSTVCVVFRQWPD